MGDVVKFPRKPQKVFDVFKVIKVTTLADREDQADQNADFNIFNGLDMQLPWEISGTLMIVERECEEA